MLDQQQLQNAIAIQQQSYELFRWLNQAINRGFVAANHAHQYGQTPLAALEWIKTHRENFPPTCRPDDSYIAEFANFFSTYLETSFDLDPKAASKNSARATCCCHFCYRVNHASHLIPKTLNRQARNQADKLRLRRLELLSREENIRVLPAHLATLSHSRDTKEALALSAYGWSLIARLSAISYGPGVLVLWRDLAWNGSGSPNKKFKLQTQHIVQAETYLCSRLKTFQIQSP